jgi:hypothetical protein
METAGDKVVDVAHSPDGKRVRPKVAEYLEKSIFDAAHNLEFGGVDLEEWRGSGLAYFVIALNFAIFGMALLSNASVGFISGLNNISLKCQTYLFHVPF